MTKENKSENSQKARSIADKLRYKELYAMNIDKLILLAKNLYKANDALTDEKNRLLKQIEQKNRQIQQLSNPDDPVIKYKGYDKEWAQVEKVIFILSRNKKPLLTKEIVKELLFIEPRLGQSLKDPYNSIAKALYVAIRLERVIQDKKIGAGGYVHVLPEWLDKNNMVLPKYRR